MTTAFAYAADGNVKRAFLTQPMGCVLALGTAAGFWGAVHIAATGSRLWSVSARMLSPRLLWGAAGATGLAWAYKVAMWH